MLFLHFTFIYSAIFLVLIIFSLPLLFYCITDRGKGEVAYYGETQFADGFWVGIILNEPKGLNNGTVKGVEYFKCENKHGIFFRPSQVHTCFCSGVSCFFVVVLFEVFIY